MRVASGNRCRLHGLRLVFGWIGQEQRRGVSLMGSTVRLADVAPEEGAVFVGIDTIVLEQ
ncbi:hypothetical protein C7H84_09270 [Burkholderia sp. Nafp2/4-1b]|nr:hypothetical protein C7H84_09270 [Burkholderia sp. Nafp2/4-1b]